MLGKVDIVGALLLLLLLHFQAQRGTGVQAAGASLPPEARGGLGTEAALSQVAATTFLCRRQRVAMALTDTPPWPRLVRSLRDVAPRKQQRDT